MRILIVAGCADLLAASVTPRRIGIDWDAANAEVQRRGEQCAAQFPTRLEQQRCSYQAMEQVYAAYGSPYMDLLHQYTTGNLVLEERYAKGELTDAELEHEKASLQVQYNDGINARVADARIQYSLANPPRTVCRYDWFTGSTICN